MKKQKPKKPRGPYRQKWVMPHTTDKDYNRSEEKEELRRILEEEEDDTRTDPDREE
jgi:hypothetical protein